MVGSGLRGGRPAPSVMGNGLRTASEHLPLTYGVRALQNAWLGNEIDPTNLIVLAGTTITLPVAFAENIDITGVVRVGNGPPGAK